MDMKPSQDEEAVRRSVAHAIGRVEKGLSPPASQRLIAGTLMLSNHMLRMAARTWGHPCVDDPRSHPEHAALAVEAFLGARDDVQAVTDWTGKNEANLRQGLALDTCAATLGHAFLPGSMPRVAAFWRILWASRGSLAEALANMRDWEIQRGGAALPPDDNGDYPDDGEALACGNGFPNFLRRGNRRSG